MSSKNTKAKYLLQDVTFDHEEAHLAYTKGAASGKDKPYILKSDNGENELMERDEFDALVSITKSDTYRFKLTFLDEELKEYVSTNKGKFDRKGYEYIYSYVCDFDDEKLYFHLGEKSYSLDYQIVDSEDETESRKAEFDDDSLKRVVRSESFIEKAKTKTVDGESLSAKDFAYVPDPDKPSTWKLPVYDKGHASAAVAALGKGFRGNKVQIPSEDVGKVKAKVREAYKKFYPDKDLPEILEKDNKDKTDKDKVQKSEENMNVSDKVEIDKSTLEAMQEQLEIFKRKEREEIVKSKTSIVKSAEFIDSDELQMEVVEVLVKSKDAVEGTVLEKIIAKAVEAVKQAGNQSVVEKDAQIKQLEVELEKSKGEVTKSKDEWAKPQGLSGGNVSKDDNSENSMTVQKSKSALADFLKSGEFKM